MERYARLFHEYEAMCRSLVRTSHCVLTLGTNGTRLLITCRGRFVCFLLFLPPWGQSWRGLYREDHSRAISGAAVDPNQAPTSGRVDSGRRDPGGHGRHDVGVAVEDDYEDIQAIEGHVPRR